MIYFMRLFIFITMNKTIYLIPVYIHEQNPDNYIAYHVNEIISNIDFFFVENVKTARRMLRKMGYQHSFDNVHFVEIGKHSSNDIFNELLQCNIAGLLSESGSPCIADPGNEVILAAHQLNFKIVALPGPSSILQSLISSGFSGQNFAFNGYLPIDKKERILKLRSLYSKMKNEKQTQIFMETPFRNNQMMNDLIENLPVDTLLSVSCEIGSESAFCKTQSLANWKKHKFDFHKKMCVFVLGL